MVSILTAAGFIIFERDAKVPRQDFGTVHEGARDIPVYRECEVLVVGGGPDGNFEGSFAADTRFHTQAGRNAHREEILARGDADLVSMARPLLADADFVQWRDLVDETFIVTSRGSGPEARVTVQGLLPPGATARFAAHHVSREGMFNLVGAGFGIAVLAESASGASYPGVVFRPVGNETGPTMVEAAAYWDPKRDNPALRRFLGQLRATQGSRAG